MARPTALQTRILEAETLPEGTKIAHVLSPYYKGEGVFDIDAFFVDLLTGEPELVSDGDRLKQYAEIAAHYRNSKVRDEANVLVQDMSDEQKDKFGQQYFDAANDRQKAAVKNVDDTVAAVQAAWAGNVAAEAEATAN